MRRRLAAASRGARRRSPRCLRALELPSLANAAPDDNVRTARRPSAPIWNELEKLDNPYQVVPCSALPATVDPLVQSTPGTRQIKGSSALGEGTPDSRRKSGVPLCWAPRMSRTPVPIPVGTLLPI